MAKRRSNLSKQRIFLDSSVLFTAVNSSFGGSAKLFVIDNVELYVSSVVLHEVERNVRSKLPSMYLDRFFNLVDKLKITRVMPSHKRIVAARKVIAQKDSVILAQFVESNCLVLLTLDKQDFLQVVVVDYVSPKRIMTPKMWFESLT